MADRHILRFGPYQLDPKNEQFWCDGQPLRLPPKVFHLLSYLAERPGQLVTKEELFRVVWADTVVGDAALTMCVQEIRKALQDNAREPQYVETVPRRGFRFIGEVISNQQEEVRSEQLGVSSQLEEEQLTHGNGSLASRSQSLESEGQSLEFRVQSLESEPHNDSLASVQTLNPRGQTPEGSASPFAWPRKNLLFTGLFLLVGALVLVRSLYFPSLFTPHSLLFTQQAQSPALPLPDKPSIVVLPFVNMSKDPEQEYFNDGMTDTLITELSQLSGLFVIARNSAFTYKGKAVKVQEVSKELGVRYVLEGSVQKANNRVRINVQLIDATTNGHVWAERFDRELQDIFVLQDEVTQRVVAALQVQVTAREQEQLVRKTTDNVEAYDALLRGRAYYFRYTREENAQARQMFERAIALDPRYADAYAILAFTHWLEWNFGWSPNPAHSLERFAELAHQAVTLDDFLPGPHVALGYVYLYKDQQFDEGIAELQKAVRLAPNNADVYQALGEGLNIAGRSTEALEPLHTAMRLNPRYTANYPLDLGWAYQQTGQYTQAIAVLQDAISRNPNFIVPYSFLALSYLQQWNSQQSPPGQTLEPALAAIQRALALNDSYYRNPRVLGWIYLYQQQYEQALAEMERAVALTPTEAGSKAGLAEVLSCMGRREDALEAAAQALRLQARVPNTHLGSIGLAYAVAGHYEEARAPLQRYLSRYPNRLDTHLILAAVYSELGQIAEARAEAAEVLRINPQFSLEVHKQRMPIKDPAVLERHISALRKAGLK